MTCLGASPFFNRSYFVSESIETVGPLAGLCGHDGDNWEKVLIDSSKRLIVAIASIVLPTGAATEAKQDVIIAAMVNKATSPTPTNVTMTSADTEYSHALSSDTKRFMVQCRGSYDVLLAFVSEQSGTTYITIKSGQNYWEDALDLTGITLYFQCATAAQILEILEWS